MPITTTRMLMAVGDYLEMEDVVKDIDNNLDIIDKNINLTPCTNATRPALLYRGQMILETDTKRIYIADIISGVLAWVPLKLQNAKGLVAFTGDITEYATLTIGMAAEAGPYLGTTITADPLRRYWVEVNIKLASNFASNNPAEIDANIRWAAGAAVTNAGTVIGGMSKLSAYKGNPDTMCNFNLIREVPPGVWNGQTTVAIFLKNVSTAPATDAKVTAGAGLRNTLLIKDVGV